MIIPESKAAVVQEQKKIGIGGKAVMKKYEYKFIEVSIKNGLKTKAGETFEECKNIIVSEAKNGWRLNQVVTPFNEKMGVYAAMGYQIILEKEI